MDQFIFTSGPIELKQEGEDFFVEGYASTSDLDLVNDIVTKDCIMDMAEQFRGRAIKFDIEHESFRGKSDFEKEINKTIIPMAKTEDFLVDKTGLKVKAKLNKNAKRFDEVKGSIEDGFLDAFSIAYVPVKSRIIEKNGQEIRMLDKINLLNVAFTGNPINPHASMTNVFAKSLEFLEEKRSAEAQRTAGRNEALNEDEEEEKKKKKTGPGGHKPDKTGPHGRGEGPGNGRADGSGVDKKDNHLRGNIVIKEGKMEEKNETSEVEEPEKEEPKVEEPIEEPEPEAKDVEVLKAEVKSLKNESDNTKKELVEIKAILNKSQIKSVQTEVKDVHRKEAEEKMLGPLDMI